MPTILTGQAASFTVTVQRDGAGVAIAANSTVTAQLFSMDGATALSPSKTLSKDAAGANWPAGVLSVAFSSEDTGALEPGEAMLVVTSSSPALVKRFRVVAESAAAAVRSSLFVRDMIIDELRADRLMMTANTVLSGAKFTDDYLWEKLRAAESEIGHDLRVPLTPTQFFPYPPTQTEIDALDGKPWAVDPAYDYDPEFFQGEKWGFLVMRQKPLIEVQRVRFVYPAPTTGFYEVPGDWLRMDRKYGHIRFVPASSPFVAPLNAFILQALGGGRTIPFAIEVNYVAGLENAARDFPELLDAIKKKTVVKSIEDSFPAQSGSISADGLSQSLSVDMEKYRETVDTILYGAPGTNGGLMTAIHGVRVSVMGA